jgi:hypothetical protein
MTKLIMSARGFLRFAALALLLFSYHIPWTQAAVTASETKLVFNLMSGSAQERTFTVEDNPLPKLSVVTHDLLEPQTGTVILSSSIKVSSAREEGSNRETFTVTVNSAAAGHFLGSLDLMNADRQPAIKLLSIALDVTLRGVPAVETDVNSKSLTVRLRQPFGNFPYLGTARPLPPPPPGVAAVGEHEIYLVQNAEQSAVVQSADVLGMRANAGNDLPPGTVRVTSSLPLKIGGGGVAALKLIAGGDNLGAGEYNGTLQIKVLEQSAAVKVPIKLLIKHGPLLALLVLFGGLLTAYLFSWWNSRGKAVSDIHKSIPKLEEEINAGPHLQLEDRQAAMTLLTQTMERIEAGDSAEEVKKKFDEAQASVVAAQKATVDFIANRLKPLIVKTEAIEPGKHLREKFLNSLAQIKDNLVKGKYQRLDDARKLVDPPRGLEKQIGDFEALVKEFDKVPVDKKDETRIKIDQATTSMALRQALTDAGVTVTVAPGGASFAITELRLSDVAPRRYELSLKTRLQLSLGKAAIVIIAFLFILAVGWISIYVKADTFGANPMDYVTLFLWGASTEAVRAQTVNITTLKALVTEKPA